MRNLFKFFMILSALSVAACSACTKEKNSSNNGGDDETGDTVEVEYYEFSPRLPESTRYAVKVAGEYIKVFPTYEPHLAWFGADGGTVKVEVSLQGEKISKAVVRPLGKNYKYELKNNKITLELQKYDRVSVEVNDDIENPLFIFVNPIDSEKPSKNDPSVMYFEAGQIYDLAKAPYNYNGGSLVLTPGCKEIYLEPGTYVKGNILGVDIDGVKIHGGGFIDASGYPGRYAKEFYQPYGIAFCRCPNSEFSDFTNLFADGGWSSLYTNCHHSNITNVKTLGLNSEPGKKTNNDSMDIIGGIDVHVSKCFMRGHDDVYCLKSQKFKLKGDDVDGIYYEDCIGWNIDAGNTFEIGYETQLNIRNVHYKDIYSIHSGTSGTDYRRAAISIHNGAAGTISDVSYTNAYLEDVQEFALYLACLNHDYNIGFDDDGNKLEYSPGKIQNVTYRNINVLNVRPGKGYCVIQGYDGEHQVSDVDFYGFNYLGREVGSLNDGIWSVRRNCSDVRFNSINSDNN